jgi:uncharacterized repeat protein (TIGR01451 family)
MRRRSTGSGRNSRWVPVAAFALLFVVFPLRAGAQEAPAITLSPVSGPAGTAVDVRGTDFLGNCGVSLSLDSADGPALGSAFVGESGAFDTTVTIPVATTPEPHLIVATGRTFATEFCGGPSGDNARAQFVVTAPTVDRSIYLKRRILQDPGIDEELLEEIAAAASPTHAIVQLERLPQAGRRDIATLSALGVALLAYLNGVTAPGTGYLASISPEVQADAPAFRALVRGLARLEPADKLALGLPPEGGAPVDLLVQVFADASAAEARALFARLGITASQYAPDLWQSSATAAQIEALAAEEIVQWVQPGPLPFLPELDEVRTVHNVDAAQNLNTGTGVYGGLSGAGVQLAISDSGVDAQHNDFAGRFIVTLDDGGAHGSHVAGIAAGSGAQSNQNDNNGTPNGGTAFQWRGVAPQAQIAAYGQFGGGTLGFLDAVVNFGVDVSNHSYPIEANGVYDAANGSIDKVIRGDSVGIPARPAVYSAGNSGLSSQYGVNPGYFSLSKVCKNCAAVGNIQKSTVRNAGSSMGPTPDGRLKPELAAVGSSVTSVASDTFAGIGNGYRSTGGTSMSAPVVTGTIALMLEQYAATFGVNLDTAPPLPSTSKAILAQTATDLIGNDGSNNPDTSAPVQYGAGPDWVTGFGQVNAQAAAQLVADRNFLEDSVSDADVTDEHIVSVVPGQQQVRVTLAWDDIAGTPNANDAAAQLVNDLDLTLIDPNGVEHDPLVLPPVTPLDCDNDATNGIQTGTCPGIDAAGQNYLGPAAEGVDRRNNIEQAFVTDPAGLPPGNWTARVSVLNDDGVTVRLPLGGTQTYSLAGVTDQRADLSVTKTDAPDPVAAGDELTYTIQVQNDGPDTAVGVVVRDTLPAGVVHVDDTGGCVPGPGPLLTCALGDIAASDSEQFTITVEVDASLVFDAGGPTTIENTVIAFSSVPDDDPADNEDTEQTQVVAVADLEIVSFAAVNPPTDAIVGQPVPVTLRKQVRNNGPSAPINATLTKTAVGSPGVTVSPALSVTPVPALALGELRQVDEVFTITCQEASAHTVTFTNVIAPANAADSDPDLSNNGAAFVVHIECVVPVAINIKPQSNPNSINLKSGGASIAVAVLTTTAGEYGLPLAFDATTIDPLSVRFGPRDVVFLELGGAVEIHSRGHIERSYELDEKTRDADRDMVLHFRGSDTGLTAASTEACVKGSWVDGGGATHSFFGCDAVRIVQP